MVYIFCLEYKHSFKKKEEEEEEEEEEQEEEKNYCQSKTKCLKL